jgi:glycosyltransferase involved in cell wall biosynthesis
VPRVSVILPTYCAAPFVRQCVDSVLAQTFEDWELVAVDDGSTDGTPDLVESCGDPRVRCLRLPHRGLRALAETYNAGLAATRGELVAVLEGDDWWPADKLAVQVPGFDDPEAQLSFGAGHEVDLEGRFPHPALFHELVRQDVLMPSISVMLRRRALERIGGFRQDGAAHFVDLPTWLHVLARNPGVTLFHHHVLGCWRRHAGQTTARHWHRIVRERWRVVEAVTASLDAEATAYAGWTAASERLNRARRTMACARALVRAGRFGRARRLHARVLGAGPGVAMRAKALKGLVSDAVGVDLSGAWRRARGRE